VIAIADNGVIDLKRRKENVNISFRYANSNKQNFLTIGPLNLFMCHIGTTNLRYHKHMSPHHKSAC